MGTLVHDSYIDEKHSHRHGLGGRTTWDRPARRWIWKSDPVSSRIPHLKHDVGFFGELVAGHESNFLLPIASIDRPAKISARTRVQEAFEHIRQEIIECVISAEITTLTAVRALVQLRYVLSPGAVFPHVVVDDGRDLCFYWLAAERRLEIVIPERGDIYVRFSGFPGRDFEGFCDELPRIQIRSAIQRISEIISDGNPDWRRVFDK